MAVIDIVAAAAATHSSQGGLVAANNLRIASIAIAGYDYLTTIPSEIRLYKTTSRRSLGFILFVLIRYLSIIVITLSNTGFFYHHFSSEVCAHYFHVAPVFKVFQLMTSQAILAVRTYNIGHRNRRLGHALISVYILIVVFEWVAELNGRIPMQTNVGAALFLCSWRAVFNSCWAVLLIRENSAVSAWSFYLAAMLFDFLTLSISTYYLLRAKAKLGSAASKLVNLLLYDGLGYFVALTVINMVNVFLYRRGSHPIQSAGVTMSFAVTWIMSQRILLHVREVRAKEAEVIVSPPPTFNTTALHSEGQTKHAMSVDGNMTTESLSPDESRKPPSEFDIEVHIDRTVIRDARQPYVEQPIDRDFYNTPRSVWEQSHGYNV